MTFTAPHNVLQILGTLESQSEAETWTCGLRLGEGNLLVGARSAGRLDAEVTNALDGLQGDLLTWWNGISQYISPLTKLIGFKFNAVDVNGRYVNQVETFRRDLAAPLPGTSLGSLPPQSSVAVTFRTIAARGLASRGRIFLPPFGAGSIDPQGRLVDTRRDDIATQTATFLTNLGNWAGLDVAADYGKVCVMSKVGLGATRRVNRVDVGDRFDVIRSRGASFTEVRSPEVAVVS